MGSTLMGWSFSPFLETRSCMEALNEGLKISKLKIINSDQRCQFTSKMWTEALKKQGIEISMDGKGRCLDNIQIERFWRSLKYEEVYLKSYESMTEVRKNIGKYIDFYNQKRPHQSLEYQTPDEAYWAKHKEGVPNPCALGF